MTETPLPQPASEPWQDKPISFLDARKGLQPGLAAFLDRVRQVPYVTAVETLQFYPTLVVGMDFIAKPATPSRVEGWFTNREARNTTRFEVVTTARTSDEQTAVVQDLRKLLLNR
jgi:hypothetical protein